MTYQSLKNQNAIENNFCKDSTQNPSTISKRIKFNLSASNTAFVQVKDGLFLVNISVDDGKSSVDDGKPMVGDEDDLPECIKRKMVQPENLENLYPSPCQKDIPCHCDFLKYETPSFLPSLCERKIL